MLCQPVNPSPLSRITEDEVCDLSRAFEKVARQRLCLRFGHIVSYMLTVLLTFKRTVINPLLVTIHALMVKCQTDT